MTSSERIESSQDLAAGPSTTALGMEHGTTSKTSFSSSVMKARSRWLMLWGPFQSQPSKSITKQHPSQSLKSSATRLRAATEREVRDACKCSKSFTPYLLRDNTESSRSRKAYTAAATPTSVRGPSSTVTTSMVGTSTTVRTDATSGSTTHHTLWMASKQHTSLPSHRAGLSIGT